MNKALCRARTTPVHRIGRRATFGSGVRWSSYVGDVRPVDNLSKSYGGRSPSRGLFSTTATAASTTAASGVDRLLVIGSGVAGCAAALSAARLGVRCTVLHAGSAATDCNSYWAQGGIIYRNYDLGGRRRTRR